MSAQNQELRFTTRGRQAMRLLRTMVCALVIVGGAFFVATQSFSAAAGAEAEAIGIDAEAVVVAEGESLWAVAADLGLDRDTRDVVSDIVDINHLSSPVVHPGQTLDVPQR
ncbi:MAG: LysM peptidoglycan-binding domain-containing protein [Brevibacterium sp.]|uniref:LysM peptidoglycan-binding domain-containing protein n=1 Tax=Brevibacterium sp. TaxID=1701 RepID=UPI0026473A36|nr:LysM peptidoglycan-binding domain-containing protein [Brevibacterium sp.]MDN5833048.1 LysM peptidoglycan-binding domain-containing protein [Brevibacterium sp.]MDN5877533.1 LysM peptidoglycan-binding domain-containing protein [Brevibacterium sp.]MDN5910903.1 LysM peptidoglycan-binding domain-containing protein [Brevibacterium sp.]MDN6122805.1 LysM peptidoglycan-binding domain-containing protein [Brevibacterium sp.]MDN6133982.1 LysM peptidoglycan-binding domain-containing protein [Brevibacter